MDALERYKRALRNQGMRAIGAVEDQSRVSDLQSATLDDVSALLRLPILYLPNAQNLDPSSDDYGKFYFVAGLHVPGDENVLISPE